MEIDWFTFIAQILNFLLLVWLLKRFLYGPVIKAMDEREARIATERNAATQAQQSATELQDEYQNQLTALQKDRADRMADAEREVTTFKQSELQQARTDVAAARSEWQRGLVREQQALLRELQLDVSQHATDIARHLLQQLADEQLQTAMVTKFVQRMSEEHLKLAELLRESDDQQPLVVESSHELPEKDRERITDALQQLTHRGASCDFRKNETLTCGIELQGPGVKVAWSIQESLAELESDLIDAIASRFSAKVAE